MKKVPLYDDFSRAYDLMVDWPRRLAREAPFFKDVFERVGARRVIDVACGTGRHARLFASWGLEVVGADASEAMIKEALSATDVESVEFIVADFLTVAESASGPFDAVVCIGNSLPHVRSLGEAREALEGFAKLLRHGGALVLQMRNADRAYRRGDHMLGPTSRTVAGVEHVFVRLYHIEPDHMDLTIVSLAKHEGHGGGWSAKADHTVLVPIFFAELRSALAGAGLTDVEAFGDYQGTPFDPVSCDDLVLSAIRP